ncbi:MAG TPA: winged helix-turn-helix domain-containing protein [Blastocatellia bacterium]|jgi:Tol biopolymer transport system component/DNA-binding winged helix-turn-helix (wHTH) protein|nr:winged helix-turn-helix domain-containing protein [Blastocatellia bacterium]
MRKQTKQLYEFGPFRLDVDERLLMRDGRMAPLPPKVFDTLLVLVENSGRVVSKDELMQSLWPDTFVEESNLTQNISQLRRALSDGTAGAQYIETIPKRGYRFVANVQPVMEGDVDSSVGESEPESSQINGGGVLQLASGGFSIEADGAINGHAQLTAVESVSAGREQPLQPGIEVPPEKMIRRRLLAIATLLFFSLAIVVFAIVVASRHAGNSAQQSRTAFQQITLSKLTTSGKALLPAISHDGKFVAYMAEDGDSQSLWIRQVVANSATQVVAPSEVVFKGVTFSLDNNFIYYVARRNGEKFNKVYQVPLLGGAAREIIADVDSPITFSPNGQYFAFVRNYPTQRETALIVAKLNGSEERKLAIRKRPEMLSLEGPSWSPDGRLIACASATFERGEFSMQALAVSVEDGSSTPIGSQTWTFIGQMAWLGDGSGVVFRTWQRTWGTYGDQIWLLTFPKGEARRVTNDMTSYGGVSVSTNSTAPAMLVTQRTDRVSRIWVLPETSNRPENAGGFAPERATQIESGFGDIDSEKFGLEWTPDGRLVYASSASGNVDVWITTADGKRQKQLTQDARTDRTPVVTPDGRYVVFASERAGGSQIWRMDADGGGLKQLTQGKSDAYPDLSLDGRWVVYTSSSGGEPAIWKVSIDGGEPAQLSLAVAARSVVSPDGKSIACFYQKENDAVFKVAIFHFSGGTFNGGPSTVPSTVIEDMPQPDWYILHWSPDGRALTYVVTRQGVSNIWSKPIDGGPARQLTNFTTDRIFRFAWSRDGKFLACERGMVINDAVLITDGKPDKLPAL